MHLGKKIQEGPHNSKDDAIASLEIYKKFESEIENEIIL